MRLVRKGSFRDRGTTTVISEAPLDLQQPADRILTESFDRSLGWSLSGKQLFIMARRIPSPDEVNATYDYTQYFTVEDVGKLISVIGEAAMGKGYDLLHETLRAQLPALIKLIACASGEIPVTAPDKK